MALSDEQLVARLARKDEDALIELYRRYAPYLAAIARRMLNSQDEVEQSVQDAFVNAWTYAERFDPKKASAKTWLATITQRLVLNRLRGKKLETLPLQSWDAPARQPDHVERIYIERALETLTEDERELIELAFYQGYTHKQVAEVTDTPLGTVKSRIKKALQKLRATMTGGEA